LECYNVITKEEDEDPWKINIPKIEGHREVEGLHVENLDITTLLKTNQVNISTKVESKLMKIEDYWDDAMVDKVIELLREY